MLKFGTLFAMNNQRTMESGSQLFREQVEPFKEGLKNFREGVLYETKKMELYGPFGGERYIPGEFQYFQWGSPYNTGDSTVISLSLDDGQTWTELGRRAENIRTFNYIMPNVTSDKARLMIHSDKMTGDTSGRFTICPSPKFNCISVKRVGFSSANLSSNYLRI